jgi:hypothetical protein
MSEEKVKVAYIEYSGKFNAIVVELRDFSGIEVFEARNLEEFLGQHGSLDNFPCLIYHPGTSQQQKIVKVREDYPHLNIGIFIGGTRSAYNPEIIYDKGVDLLMCDLKDIVKWVRDNQQQRASPPQRASEGEQK